MPTPTPAPGSPPWMRPLGVTGLQVSAVFAGGSPLGSMPGVYGHTVGAEQGVATVRAVLDSPIRRIDTSSPRSPLQGGVDALVALKEAGEIGAIGIAGGPVQEMERYVELDVFDVLLVHNRWTLVDRSAGRLIAAARDRGMGVLDAAVYGGGMLTGGGAGVTTYGYPRVAQTIAAASAEVPQALWDELESLVPDPDVWLDASHAR